MNSIALDVRPILAAGGTPCAAIDEATARVGLGESLVLLVPFEPVPLYTKLGRQGFDHRTEQLTDGTWRVEFTRTAEVPESDREPVACACGH